MGTKRVLLLLLFVFLGACQGQSVRLIANGSEGDSDTDGTLPDPADGDTDSGPLLDGDGWDVNESRDMDTESPAADGDGAFEGETEFPDGDTDSSEESEGWEVAEDGCLALASTCYINDLCYSAGAVSPASFCQFCSPSASRVAWTPKPYRSVCSDNDRCTYDEHCDAKGACVGTTYTCEDGYYCRGNGYCGLTTDTVSGICTAKYDGATYCQDANSMCTCVAKDEGWYCRGSENTCGHDGFGVCVGHQFVCSIAGPGKSCAHDVACGGGYTCGELWNQADIPATHCSSDADCKSPWGSLAACSNTQCTLKFCTSYGCHTDAECNAFGTNSCCLSTSGGAACFPADYCKDARR